MRARVLVHNLPQALVTMGLTNFTDKSRSRVWYAIDKDRNKVIRWDEFCAFMGQDTTTAIKEHKDYQLSRQDSGLALELAKHGSGRAAEEVFAHQRQAVERHGSGRAASPGSEVRSSPSPSPIHQRRAVERQLETDASMTSAEETTDGGQAQVARLARSTDGEEQEQSEDEMEDAEGSEAEVFSESGLAANSASASGVDRSSASFDSGPSGATSSSQ